MAIGSGLGAQVGLAAEAYVNEVQTVSGTPSGVFGVTFDGANTVATLATTCTAAAMQTALNALPNLGGGIGTTLGVACTGGPLPSAITVTFSGALVSGRNQPQLVVQGAVTGLSVATPTPGSGYGDAVTVTRFLEVENESLSLTVQRIESSALRAGTRVLRTDRWASNRKGVSGDVNLEVATTGFGLLFKQMLGASVITTPPSGVLTRDHTYTIADPTGQSQTWQIGRPDTNGNPNPFTYKGCKIASWELSNDVDGLLMLKVTLDAMDEDQSISLAAAAYPANQQPLSFVGGSVTIGGANVGYCTKISITGNNQLDGARYYIRNNTLKREPTPNAQAQFGGSLTLEFNDTSAYNRYVNGQTAQIVAAWQGSQIEAAGPGYNYLCQATIPNARFDGSTPNVGGPDIISYDQPFTGLYDGTNSPLTLLYRTTDTAD